jgi:hypothetical protein
MLIAPRNMSPPDLHNIYEGRQDSWQLNEPVEGFLQRLPPLTTSVSVCPWIWVANPYPDGRDTSGRATVQQEFIPRGLQLLQESLQERENIRKNYSQTATARVIELLNEETEWLKCRIATLAGETNVLSGKVRH